MRVEKGLCPHYGRKPYKVELAQFPVGIQNKHSIRALRRLIRIAEKRRWGFLRDLLRNRERIRKTERSARL